MLDAAWRHHPRNRQHQSLSEGWYKGALGLGAAGAWPCGPALMVGGTEGFRDPLMAAGVARSRAVLPFSPVEGAAQRQTSRIVWMPLAGSINALTSAPKSKGLDFLAGTELCATRCLMHGRGGQALLVTLLWPSS